MTLRIGYELSLDFGIVDAQGATVVAVAALIGGVDMEEPTLKITDPVTGDARETPFVEVFHESDLH